MDEVSEYVKKQREARNVTLEELSKGTLISVTTLKDIENGKFDKYKGDELYVKMYLKRIAEFLELDSTELIDNYVALTKEITLEDIKKEEKRLKKIEENRKNVKVVDKIGGTLKDIKPSASPLPSRKSKGVYEDNLIKRYLKYGLVILLCAVIIFVFWYSIVESKSSDSTDYTKSDNTIVEENKDSTPQETKDTSKEETEDENTEDENTGSNLVLTKTGESAYEVTGLTTEDALKIEVTFSVQSNFKLWKNGTPIVESNRVYNPGEVYTYEETVTLGETYIFNIWKLGDAIISVNGQIMEYDATKVRVVSGVSYFELYVKGE